MTKLKIATNGKQDGKKAKISEQPRETSSAPKTIEGTPFATVKINEEVRIILGRHVITDKYFLTHEAASIYMLQTDWITILNVVTIMFENLYELKSKNNAETIIPNGN